MKTYVDISARVLIFVAMALRRGRVVSPMLGRNYPGKTRYSFIVG